MVRSTWCVSEPLQGRCSRRRCTSSCGSRARECNRTDFREMCSRLQSVKRRVERASSVPARPLALSAPVHQTSGRRRSRGDRSVSPRPLAYCQAAYLQQWTWTTSSKLTDRSHDPRIPSRGIPEERATASRHRVPCALGQRRRKRGRGVAVVPGHCGTLR